MDNFMTDNFTNNSDANTGTINIIICIVSICEMIIRLFDIPIAALNAKVIAQTSVVHPNLKFILLVQSSQICILSICRVTIEISKFISNDLYSNGFYAALFPAYFSGVFLTYTGHILLLERILATVLANKYETYTNYYFSVCWFIILSIISAVVSYIQVIQQNNVMEINEFILSLNYLALLLSVVEIIVFIILGVHNRRKYLQQNFVNQIKVGQQREQRQQKPKQQNLSERYQLAENIRNAKQLKVTFAMHTVEICCSCPFVTGLYLHFKYFPTEISYPLIYMIFSISMFIWAIADLVILISVMIFHPVLNQKVKAHIRQGVLMLWSDTTRGNGNNEVGPEPNINVAGGSRVAWTANNTAAAPTHLVTVLGGPLLNHSEPSTHFEMLTNYWKSR